jgi:hypothetical protein
MKQIFAILMVSVLIFAGVVVALHAKQISKRSEPNLKIMTDNNTSDRPLHWNALHSVAVADTYVLAQFNFDTPYGTQDPQGWVSVDKNEQLGTFFHVDDFADLGGGDFGNLTPLAGDKSLWCGVRADTSEPLCGYGCLPGYGNHWDQRFESRAFARQGTVTVSFSMRYDSEAGCDYNYLEYMDSTGVWRGISDFSGRGESLVNEIVPGDAPEDSIRIRFVFYSDGVYSDEDCLWNSDGAVIIDSLTIADTTGTLDFQDFEGESVGATSTNDGDWTATVKPSLGDYSGLFCGCGVLQEDPCVRNISYLWGFFKGSTDEYCPYCPDCSRIELRSSIDPSEQMATPVGKDIEEEAYLYVYQHNEIWSPAISWTHDIHGTPVPSTASSAKLEFDVYRDLPLCKLVFWVWGVRSRIDDCFLDWKDRNFVYYGGQKDWHTRREEVSDLIHSSAQEVQLAIGVRDMSEYWGIWGGPCYCHSHGPLIDNVRLIRIEHHGPVWTVYEFDLFQDNFAEDGTSTGTVRTDAANDILPSSSSPVVPGDSVVVTVSEANYGLDTDGTHGGAAIYLHVKDIGSPKSGDAISGELSRWPVAADGGGTGWTVLRMDTVFNTSGDPVSNRFCVDLNDNLYTPGDTIWFYMSARDEGNNTSYWSLLAGTVDYENQAQSYPLEMTCLPANGLNGATDILYVDDFDGGGAQPYFDQAFDMLGITPDRYDVRLPNYRDGNGPGARVVDVAAQLIPYYKKIIWNSGDIDRGTIGDGDYGDKSDDFQMLFDFLDLHTEDAGVYISGDDVVAEWNFHLYGTSAIDFKNKFMNHLFVNDDHVTTGEPLSPLVIGQPGSIFEHGGAPDTLVAYGGCPGINNFDVLAATGSSTLEKAYSNNVSHGAILSQDTLNTMGATARVVLSGFSYHEIRDDKVHFPTDRLEHLSDILEWLGNTIDDPTAVVTEPVYRNSLSQNYPNPFNPVTKIRYSIEMQGPVSLKIYDVAGRLIKTLVNEIQQPNSSGYSVRWDGTNTAGMPVSSGIYFFKINTKNFSRTKKMVLLK